MYYIKHILLFSSLFFSISLIHMWIYAPKSKYICFSSCRHSMTWYKIRHMLNVQFLLLFCSQKPLFMLMLLLLPWHIEIYARKKTGFSISPVFCLQSHSSNAEDKGIEMLLRFAWISNAVSEQQDWRKYYYRRKKCSPNVDVKIHFIVRSYKYLISVFFPSFFLWKIHWTLCLPIQA